MNLEQLEKENDMLRQALVKLRDKYEALEQNGLKYKSDEELLKENKELESRIEELENILDDIRRMANY